MSNLANQASTVAYNIAFSRRQKRQLEIVNCRIAQRLRDVNLALQTQAFAATETHWPELGQGNKVTTR